MLEGDTDLGRFFELATTNKKYVNGLNLHEIKHVVMLVIQVDLKGLDLC